MKMFNLKKLCAAALSLTMLATALIPGVSAADEATAVIDSSRSTSLSLYKYDMTGAEDAGVWTTETYVSTGIQDDAVNTALKDYAIQGVEFTYLKVADIGIYKNKAIDGGQVTMPVYGFQDGSTTTTFLTALGLTTADAYYSDSGVWYFESDTLIDALSESLYNNSTATKTALESYISDNGGTAMPETDENGYSSVSSLDQGLYLLVETRVPENVTSTTDPFLVSLPMTTIDGDEWNYDVTVYPKNETGKPTLEKTVRESKADTGKNNGTDNDITDGYAHTATASDGDVVDYQIISTLPTITSPATALTTYTYVDTMTKGIQYNGAALEHSDVVIEFFKDAACTDLVTTWQSTDGKFNVSYSDYSQTTGSSMTITMTEAGLAEINGATTVYDSSTSLLRGYSNLTMRITYSCTVNSDASVVYGDNGNPNTVELTWKRTNTAYYDTLKDDCHVYTYGVDLLKQFSDNNGDFSQVKFLVHNTTDGYYVQAALNESEGIYYVTGHTDQESEATLFAPMSGDVNQGRIIVKGLEDDTYVITETETDHGYTLLKDNITIVITAQASNTVCDVCGKALLTATATVNGNAVAMTEDNSSAAAIVPLTVVNTKGYNLPVTGGSGTVIFYVLGILAMVASAGAVVLIVHSNKKNRQHGHA